MLGVAALIEITKAAAAAIATGLSRFLRALLALVPGPPAAGPQPPDIDGRRPSTAETTALEVEMLRKDGHGGPR